MSGVISDFFNPNFVEGGPHHPAFKTFVGRDLYGMVFQEDLLEPRPVLVCADGSSHRDLWLGHPTHKNYVGYEADGTPIELDSLKPTLCFGQQLLHADKPALVWAATSTKSNLSTLDSEFYPFMSGAMVSPRVRKVIEDYGAPEVEFIPLQIFHRRKPDVLLGEWWYLNVFHWKEVFDLSRSKGVVYFRAPEHYLKVDWGRFQARFAYGDKQVWEVDDLFPLPQAYEGGFFLSNMPYHRVLDKLFLGYELARRINQALPAKKRGGFSRKRFGKIYLNGPFLRHTPEEEAEIQSMLVKD